MSKIPEAVGALVGVLAVVIWVVVWVFGIWMLRTYTLAKLWGWFVVPLFKFQPITYMQAFAIGLVMAFLSSHQEHNNSEWQQAKARKAVDYVYLLSYPVLTPLLFLLIGWIAKAWVM
jgi:hypothetical protein